MRTLDDTEYYGVNEYSADSEHQLWQFIAKPGQADGESTLYAMVNKAGEYVPALGILTTQNGSVNQDTRFPVATTTDGQLPDDAYAFTLTAEGTISDSDIQHYNPTIHNMAVGDTYITIRPQQYRNSKTDETSVADNTIYCLNAAGNARNFLINLWQKETAPTSSEFWTLVPENREAPEPSEPIKGPETGIYYHLVNGYAGTYATNEQRPNACFGVRNFDDTDYYSVNEFNTEDKQQQWTFVPKPDQAEGETTLYAMVNKAGEYVPVLGTIVDKNGSIYQDTRFPVATTTDGQLPDDAYGFIVTPEGKITEANLSNYDPTIHGMKVGDVYITIRPDQYRNSKTDAESVAANPNYYLNAAGNGRNFLINLWVKEAAPTSSEFWILIPAEEEEEPAPAVAPETPVMTCTVEPADGVVIIPQGKSVNVTLTAETDAQIAYAFTDADDTAEPEYTVLNESTTTLMIDKSGTLTYYAKRGDLVSETATVSFKIDDLSAIGEINAENAPACVYDLQGRRVVSPSKGLFIINGKKTIIR